MLYGRGRQKCNLMIGQVALSLIDTQSTVITVDLDNSRCAARQLVDGMAICWEVGTERATNKFKSSW